MEDLTDLQKGLVRGSYCAGIEARVKGRLVGGIPRAMDWRYGRDLFDVTEFRGFGYMYRGSGRL